MNVDQVINKLRSINCTHADAKAAADLLEAQREVIEAYKQLCASIPLVSTRHDRESKALARLAELEWK